MGKNLIFTRFKSQ